MDREPGDFSRDVPDASNRSDDAIDRVLAELPIPLGIKPINEDSEDDDARALADVAAGRFVTQEQLADWVRNVGTPDHRPMPREWLE